MDWQAAAAREARERSETKFMDAMFMTNSSLAQIRAESCEIRRDTWDEFTIDGLLRPVSLLVKEEFQEWFKESNANSILVLNGNQQAISQEAFNKITKKITVYESPISYTSATIYDDLYLAWRGKQLDPTVPFPLTIFCSNCGGGPDRTGGPIDALWNLIALLYKMYGSYIDIDHVAKLTNIDTTTIDMDKKWQALTTIWNGLIQGLSPTMRRIVLIVDSIDEEAFQNKALPDTIRLLTFLRETLKERFNGGGRDFRLLVTTRETLPENLLRQNGWSEGAKVLHHEGQTTRLREGQLMSELDGPLKLQEEAFGQSIVKCTRGINEPLEVLESL
jgi:hypothetical protein